MTRAPHIHVYATRTDRVVTADAPFEAWLSLLPPQQTHEVMQYVHQPDKERALVSRLLQIAVVSAHTGVPPADVRIIRSPGAKPRAVSRKYIDYNVSHHGPWVIVACSTRPSTIVGVDVVSKNEPVPRGYSPLSWCRAEAYLKALGVGLGGMGKEPVPPHESGWLERAIELDADHAAIVVCKTRCSCTLLRSHC